MKSGKRVGQNKSSFVLDRKLCDVISTTEVYSKKPSHMLRQTKAQPNVLIQDPGNTTYAFLHNIRFFLFIHFFSEHTYGLTWWLNNIL